MFRRLLGGIDNPGCGCGGDPAVGSGVRGVHRADGRVGVAAVAGRRTPAVVYLLPATVGVRFFGISGAYSAI